MMFSQLSFISEWNNSTHHRWNHDAYIVLRRSKIIKVIGLYLDETMMLTLRHGLIVKLDRVCKKYINITTLNLYSMKLYFTMNRRNSVGVLDVDIFFNTQ